MIRYPRVRTRLGRCPDCGVSVEVRIEKGQPAAIPLHGCPVRLCVYPGCAVTNTFDRMVERPGGEWYCPVHGLLFAAKDLVALYRAKGDADWTAVSEFVSETLPALIGKIERWEWLWR